MFTQARLLITGVVILAVLALGGYVWWVRKTLAEARARVVTAEQQSDLNAATGAIAEETARTEIIIRTQAERSADVVQSAPGATTPLDPAFSDSLRGELERMRQPQGSDDQHSPDVAGAVR